MAPIDLSRTSCSRITYTLMGQNIKILYYSPQCLKFLIYLSLFPSTQWQNLRAGGCGCGNVLAMNVNTFLGHLQVISQESFAWTMMANIIIVTSQLRFATDQLRFLVNKLHCKIFRYLSSVALKSKKHIFMHARSQYISVTTLPRKFCHCVNMNWSRLTWDFRHCEEY